MSKSPNILQDTLRENLIHRANIIRSTTDNNTAQGLMIENCSRDILFWFEYFAWTYNPRLEGVKYIPFLLYDFQKKYVIYIKNKIKSANDGETIITEKCRDMGVSWMILSVFYWFWLFRENHDFLIGSRKEEFVDKKKLPDTLFGKLDILRRKTPKWMLPKGFSDSDNTHMVLRNPANGSMIKGESSNSDFSRSGRYKASLMDEMAFWKNSASAHSAASESCNLIIAVSTPNPEGSGHFKYLVDRPEKYEKTRLEHTLHPIKNAEWLKEQYEKKSPEVISVEILMDYAGAITGKVYSRAMNCEVHDKYDYDSSLPLFRSWDFGHGGHDPTVIHWYQVDKSNKIRLIDRYEKGEEDINFFAAIALGDKMMAQSHQEYSGIMYSEEDIEGIEMRKNWKSVDFDFGDPYSANQRTFIKQTTISKELAKHGIYLTINTGSRVFDRIEKGRVMMNRLVVHPRALVALEMIAQARFPTRSENSQSTTTTVNPIHDKTSHDRTAYEYFCDNFENISNYEITEDSYEYDDGLPSETFKNAQEFLEYSQSQQD